MHHKHLLVACPQRRDGLGTLLRLQGWGTGFDAVVGCRGCAFIIKRRGGSVECDCTGVYRHANDCEYVFLSTPPIPLYRQGSARLTWVYADFSKTDVANILENISVGRFGDPREVADAAVFLAQNEYANNCTLNIDGGLSAV